MKSVRIGVIGCGNISSNYLNGCRMYPILDVVACADLDIDRARETAAQHNIPRVCSVEELLGDPEIEIILNLTTPRAHAEVNLAAIEAGKAAYSEKPLAVTREEGLTILAEAQERGVLVGGAPDTFLGGAHQMCRRIIDDGWIGRPVGAFGCWVSGGVESRHPDPEFYYQKGSGPMFDAGPYCVTALIHMLGPAKRVTGSAQMTFPERIITSAKKYGARITVEIPTYISGVVDFACGAVGTVITTFDVMAHGLPFVEVYGTEGSLRVPDPNCFGGVVEIFRPEGFEVKPNSGDKKIIGASQWFSVEWRDKYQENARGIGLADMAYALRTGRKHRASGELAYHFLDIAHAFHDASRDGKHVEVKSTCEQPEPFPVGLEAGILDD